MDTIEKTKKISSINDAWKTSLKNKLNEFPLSEKAKKILVSKMFDNLDEVFDFGDSVEKRESLFPEEIRKYLENLFSNSKSYFNVKNDSTDEILKEYNSIFDFFSSGKVFLELKGKKDIDGFRKLYISGKDGTYVFGFVFPGNIDTTLKKDDSENDNFKKFTLSKADKNGITKGNAIKLKVFVIDFNRSMACVSEKDINLNQWIDLEDRNKKGTISWNCRIMDILENGDEPLKLNFEIVHDETYPSGFYFGLVFPDNQVEKWSSNYYKSRLNFAIITE